MDNQKREFKGVFIPAKIWLHDQLPLIKKCLLAEIDSLDNAFGCTANNRHFSEFSGLEPETISKLIKSLEKDGWCTITYTNDNTREGRVIKINQIKYQGLDSTPPVVESTPPLLQSTPPVVESEHKEHLNIHLNIPITEDQILAKITGFKNSPLYPKYNAEFESLTNLEIQRKLEIFLNDYPSTTNTTICGFLHKAHLDKINQEKRQGKKHNNTPLSTPSEVIQYSEQNNKTTKIINLD